MPGWMRIAEIATGPSSACAAAAKAGHRRAALGDRAARRWPAFAAAAHAELGPVAISAIPIQPGIDVLGVLTLYQRPARPLEKEPAVAQFVADTLGAALLRDGGLQEDMGNGPWST